MRRVLSLDLKARPPFSFELTVKKPAGWHWSTPDERYDALAKTLRTTMRLETSGRCIGVKLRGAGPNRVRVEAHARTPLAREEREEFAFRVRHGLGVDEDLGAFYRLAARDPVLRGPARRLRGMRGGEFGSAFDRALLAITLQMAPIKRSYQMMRGLLAHYGEAVSFDGVRVTHWPAPERLSKTSEAELRRRCLLGYRAKPVRALAREAAAGRAPTLRELLSLSREEARERLLGLPGIGDYSADIITPHPSMPLDVWSARIFGFLLEGRVPRDSRGAIARLKAKANKRWGRWAWHAFLYVAQDLPGLARDFRAPWLAKDWGIVLTPREP
jgi:DNA-3-methyladenine glycosylase II